jgi:hypothetical protein
MVVLVFTLVVLVFTLEGHRNSFTLIRSLVSTIPNICRGAPSCNAFLHAPGKPPNQTQFKQHQYPILPPPSTYCLGCRLRNTSLLFFAYFCRCCIRKIKIKIK